MLATLKEIICEYVEVDPEQITPESSLRFDLGASSFDMMNIAVAIEEEFKVSVPNNSFPKIKNVGDIVTWLENNTK